MSYRRRRRWLRRMALGLAFASVLVAGRASVAAAKVDEPRQTPYMSLQEDTYGDSRELPEPFVAGVTDFPRVQVGSSAVAAQPEPTSDGNWRLGGNDALTLGIGAVLLVLGLGLAVSYLRRPRLAGL